MTIYTVCINITMALSVNKKNIQPLKTIYNALLVNTMVLYVNTTENGQYYTIQYLVKDT